MPTSEDAKELVWQLSPDKLAEFRRWFAECDWLNWDLQIDADAVSGKLDPVMVKAMAEYELGRATEIRSTTPQNEPRYAP